MISKMEAEKIARKMIWFSLCGFAFFSPWSIAGAQTALGVGLLAWLARMVISGKIDFVRTPLNLPILVYLVTQAISVAVSPYKALSLRALGEEWLVLIFFLMVNNVQQEQKVKKLLIILVSVSTLIGLYAVWQHYTGMDLYRGASLEQKGNVFLSLGFFDHHLTFGGYYMLVFLLAFILLLDGTRWGIFRILDFLSPVVLGFSLLFSYARSAWLGVMTGIIAFGFLKGGRFVFYLILGMILLCLLVYFIEPTSWERVKEINLSKDRPESTRIRLWQTSFNMIKDKPILGIGLGNFERLFEKYKVEGYYDITCHPHNDFLNVAVNSGLLGLLAYLWIWIVFLQSTLKSILRNDTNDFSRSARKAGMVAIVGFLIASLLQCYYTDAEVNMLVMFILGWTTVLNRKSQEETT
jgi:putative inorganic carbon (HCO3(-)) transporter